jgi:hypothetical protein
VFSAEGSTRFMQEAKKRNINYRIDVRMDGYKGTPPGGPWTPDKVYAALEWFKENAEGINAEAKLKHYSTVEPTYSRTIPVAPLVFAELKQLYLDLWEVRSLFGSLPPVYQRNLNSSFVQFDTSVMSSREALCTDLEQREKLKDTGSKLLSTLRTIAARREFFEKVKAARKNEPATSSAIGGRGEPWLYGFSSYDHSPVAVQIQAVKQNYAADWRIGWRENTLRFGPDPTKRIVGWQVISNWGGDHNGDWWKETDGSILLNNVGSVHVKSEYDRGTNWSVIWYVVDAKDDLFD